MAVITAPSSGRTRASKCKRNKQSFLVCRSHISCLTQFSFVSSPPGATVLKHEMFLDLPLFFFLLNSAQLVVVSARLRPRFDSILASHMPLFLIGLHRTKRWALKLNQSQRATSGTPPRTIVKV